jgi:hypothetical protein
MKKLILDIQKGGLGDHLFYSHIPRIAVQTGAYEQVLISENSIFRNPEYRKLVWETNPFVAGFTHEPGMFFFPEQLMNGCNLLDTLMLLYGLDDRKRMHEPELYFQPALIPELAEVSLFDPNFISYTGDLASGRLIEEWLQKNGETVTHQMKQLGARYLKLNNKTTLSADSLFEFCSILVSVKHIYGLTSGTVTLAAALRKPATVFYGSGHLALYRHSAMHRYIHLGSDFNLLQRIRKTGTAILQKFIRLGTP